MNIEQSIEILKEFNKIKINSYAMRFVNISYPDLQEAIETLLTAYEKEKRLAETNLKDSKEFQDNMCNHRCILNSKVEELEEELEKEKEERERIGKLYYEANENCIKYEQELKKEKEKNKSLEQENSFLKMMYRGTDEFKAIEKLAKEE